MTTRVEIFSNAQKEFMSESFLLEVISLFDCSINAAEEGNTINIDFSEYKNIEATLPRSVGTAFHRACNQTKKLDQGNPQDQISVTKIIEEIEGYPGSTLTLIIK